MKEYLLVAKGSRQIWDAMDDHEWEPVMQGFQSWIKSMKEKGLWIRGDRLTEKKVGISKSKNGVSVTDGPYVETKEALTGFFLFRAGNMAEAIEFAKGCPSLLHDGLDLHEMEGDR